MFKDVLLNEGFISVSYSSDRLLKECFEYQQIVNTFVFCISISNNCRCAIVTIKDSFDNLLWRRIIDAPIYNFKTKTRYELWIKNLISTLLDDTNKFIKYV